MSARMRWTEPERLDWGHVRIGPAPRPRPARYPAVRAFLIDMARAVLLFVAYLLAIGLPVVGLILAGLHWELFK